MFRRSTSVSRGSSSGEAPIQTALTQRYSAILAAYLLDHQPLETQAYRNFCGAYNRGPALWEQACRPVIFVAWKMMRPRWWAGWRENAIQQSEEMPRVRACDEEERADRQGRPAVEMPGLPVELDDAAAAAQAGADAGGVPFLAAGAVIPKGGGLRVVLNTTLPPSVYFLSIYSLPFCNSISYPPVNIQTCSATFFRMFSCCLKCQFH